MDKKMFIVDLNTGSYNKSNKGYELYNLEPNKIDGRYYGYVPDADNPNIETLGATKEQKYVDDILVVFVTPVSDNDLNRVVVGYYPSARVHRHKKSGENMGRDFEDYDGSRKIATYSIESDDCVIVNQKNSFIIEINKYNNKFRRQRVYKGTYPKLDEELFAFISNYENSLFDDDNEIQNEIQYVSEASEEEMSNASKRKVEYENLTYGTAVKRNARLSKSAIVKVNYKCEFDENHKTFANVNNFPYMEGHHLIPCTINNAKMVEDKMGCHIDCPENIVSLCPNCHRAIHFGNEKTKFEIIIKLYNDRKDKLEKVGIKISLQKLLSLYGVRKR